MVFAEAGTGWLARMPDGACQGGLRLVGPDSAAAFPVCRNQLETPVPTLELGMTMICGSV